MTFSQRAVEAALKAYNEALSEIDTTNQEPVSLDDIRMVGLNAALLAALAVDGVALVPKTDLQRVVDIAGRNEAAPEIERVRALLPAASEGEKRK